MKIRTTHRKRVRHYNEPGHCHELTFSCYRRMPLLTNDDWREKLSRSIDRAIDAHAFSLVAFVYMPEHIHLLVYPREPSSKVEDLLYAIKRPYSFRIKWIPVTARSLLLARLTVQERHGKMVFRFWQEGLGYDRNLTSPEAIVSSIDYIHMNPVRRKLANEPVEWRWSSCRFYSAGGRCDDAPLPKLCGLPSETWDP
ncbi:MAG: REP-associated tyrosine transposase [Thermoguttaceae bacterium]